MTCRSLVWPDRPPGLQRCSTPLPLKQRLKPAPTKTGVHASLETLMESETTPSPPRPPFIPPTPDEKGRERDATPAQAQTATQANVERPPVDSPRADADNGQNISGQQPEEAEDCGGDSGEPHSAIEPPRPSETPPQHPAKPNLRPLLGWIEPPELSPATNPWTGDMECQGQRQNPLLFPLLAYASGILFAALLPPVRFPSWELLSLNLLLLLSILMRLWQPARWILLVLIALAGTLSLPFARPTNAQPLSALDRADPVILQGVVLEAQRISNGRSQVVMEAERVEPLDYGLRPRHLSEDPSEAPRGNRVLMVVSGLEPLPGDRLRCLVRLSRFEPAGNPDDATEPFLPANRWDRRASVLSAGCLPYAPWVATSTPVSADPTAFELSSRLIDLVETSKHGLLSFRADVRRRLRDWYHARAPETAGLLMGLVLGERDELDRETRLAFSRSGLAHLLAISGSHFALIASGIEQVLGTCLFFLFLPHARNSNPAAAFDWCHQRLASVLAMLPTAGYALLVGLSPSIGRAVLMTLTALALKWRGRRVRGVALLTLAGGIILLVEPTALGDVGTQLSFASVWALITFPPRWNRWAEQTSLPAAVLHRMPGPFQPFAQSGGKAAWLLLITSLAASLATAPLCAYYFSSTPVMGIVANLLAVPLLGALCMPPLLVASALFLLGIPGADALLSLAVRIIEPGLAVANFFGDADRFPTLDWQPSLLQVLVVLALTVAIVQQGRTRTLLASSSLLLLMLTLAPACFTPPARSLPMGAQTSAAPVGAQVSNAPPLKVTQLNVGQGDGAVLEFPDGRVMVIDAGGSPAGEQASSDPGARVMLPYLRARGYGRIDVMVLTHPHPDHMGGLLALADALPVGELWVSRLPDRDGLFQALVSELEHKGTRIQMLSRESNIPSLGSVQVRCLHPSNGWEERMSRRKDRSVNNSSLVLEFSFGDVQMLFTGDIESAVEAQLVTDRVLRPVEVVKVPHHGSNTSSTSAFIDTVDASIGLVGVGRDNRFGFPRRSVVRGWEVAGTHLYRTDQDGAITLETDGKRLWGKTWGVSRARTFEARVTAG